MAHFTIPAGGSVTTAFIVQAGLFGCAWEPTHVEWYLRSNGVDRGKVTVNLQSGILPLTVCYAIDEAFACDGDVLTKSQSVVYINQDNGRPRYPVARTQRAP